MKKNMKKIMAVVMAFVFLAGGIEMLNDNVRIYASDSQDSNSTALSVPNPQYYYSFDSDIGDAVVVNRAKDKSDWVEDEGTEDEESSSVQLPEPDPSVNAKYAEGKRGKALDLDGTYALQIPVQNLGRSYTVSFWVKVDVTLKNFTPVFFAGRDFDDNEGYKRWIAITKRDNIAEGAMGGTPFIWSRSVDDDVFPWYCHQEEGSKQEITGDVITPEDGWRHVILTVAGNKSVGWEKGDGESYSGLSATTYVDGVFYGSGCVVDGIYDSDGTSTYLGIDLWDDKFEGYIDELAFYSQSVTATQAKRIYEQSTKTEGTGTGTGTGSETKPVTGSDAAPGNGNNNQSVSTTPVRTPVPGNLSQKNPVVDRDSNASTSMGVKSLAKVSSLKLKAKKKAFTATWKKVQNATKYQVQYADSKKKLEKAKKKTVGKTSVTIKGLKKKKTYYVRVRAYMKKDKKTIYGKWSSVKKIKIKK